MYRHVVDGSSPEYLCGMLDIDRPVLLAPMAHIAGGRPAAAVSDAAGLGLIGGGRRGSGSQRDCGPEEFTGRSLRSELTERWANDSEGLREILQVVKLSYAEAAENDDMTKRVVWAGEGVGGVDAIVPAASIVARFPAVR